MKSDIIAAIQQCRSIYCFNHYFFIRLLSLFIASIVFSLSPKEVSLNQHAPFLPKPSPGVPTT